MTFAAHRHNVNELLSNSTFFYICCFSCLMYRPSSRYRPVLAVTFLHLYLLFLYYNFFTILIVTVGIRNSVNFTSG